MIEMVLRTTYTTYWQFIYSRWASDQIQMKYCSENAWGSITWPEKMFEFTTLDEGIA